MNKNEIIDLAILSMKAIVIALCFLAFISIISGCALSERQQAGAINFIDCLGSVGTGVIYTAPAP